MFEQNKFCINQITNRFYSNYNLINYLTSVNQKGVFGPNYALMTRIFFFFIIIIQKSKHLMIKFQFNITIKTEYL